MSASRPRSGHFGLVLGIAAGLAWLALPFVPAECAPPTEASEDFCNRLWTAPLAGMCIGFLALFAVIRQELSRVAVVGLVGVIAGTALMFAGNFSEYWFMNDLPHEGPEGWIRGVAFMTLLFGFVVVLAGASLVGVVTWQQDGAIRWIGLPFAATIPAAILFTAIGVTGIAALGALAVTTSTLGLMRTRQRTAAPWPAT